MHGHVGGKTEECSNENMEDGSERTPKDRKTEIEVERCYKKLAGYPASLEFPPSLQPSLTASLPPLFASLHQSVKCNGITSASRPPTLRNITSSVTSSNVDRPVHPMKMLSVF